MTQAIVFVEHADGNARRASLECVGAARAAGATVIAVLCGAGAAEAAAKVTGASEAVVLAGPAEYSPDAVAAACAELVQSRGAQGFFAAATYRGKDLAPRVAAHLDVTPFADCIGLTAGAGGFEVRRPWLAGKCVATLGSSATMVATTRLNVFKAAAEGAPANVAEHALSAAPKARVTSIEAKASARLDVKEAPVVVAGGRGLQDAEKFKVVEDLAAAFGNAAIGASRAIVDAGWRPHGEQVGQTGKTVSPQLYIAIGISGAIQHLAGMRTSGTIVAINKDKDAPIFKVADYGIVGDAFEIVPALTAAVQAIKAQA